MRGIFLMLFNEELTKNYNFEKTRTTAITENERRAIIRVKSCLVQVILRTKACKKFFFNTRSNRNRVTKLENSS